MQRPAGGAHARAAATAPLNFLAGENWVSECITRALLITSIREGYDRLAECVSTELVTSRCSRFVNDFGGRVIAGFHSARRFDSSAPTAPRGRLLFSSLDADWLAHTRKGALETDWRLSVPYFFINFYLLFSVLFVLLWISFFRGFSLVTKSR